VFRYIFILEKRYKKKLMKKPYIIGITGGSGSGKTTFLRKIQEAFEPSEVCIVSQDDYYFPREQQETDSEGYQNFDLPKSIDKKTLYADLVRLINNEPVEKTEYMFNNKDAVPKKYWLQPAPVIVVEGLFVLHYRKVRALCDLKMFVHAKENLKIIRRIKRDQIERGYPIEDVLYRYEHHVMPSYEKYILPYMEIADVVINNNGSLDQGLEVALGFLKNKVKNG
jgi:uridine kinase